MNYDNILLGQMSSFKFFSSQSPDLQRFFRFSPLLLSDSWFLSIIRISSFHKNYVSVINKIRKQIYDYFFSSSRMGVQICLN